MHAGADRRHAGSRALACCRDGALGFWKALDELFPGSIIRGAVPQSVQPGLKAALQEISLAPTRAEAEVAIDLFTEAYQARCPKAMECMRKDQRALLAFYDLPAEHWIHLRTTDALDKSFSSERDWGVMVRGRPPRYSSIARATPWPRAGRRMQSPPRCLHSRSSFVASAHPGRFGAVRFPFGRSLQALTKRPYAASAWATKARSASRSALML